MGFTLAFCLQFHLGTFFLFLFLSLNISLSLSISASICSNHAKLKSTQGSAMRDLYLNSHTYCRQLELTFAINWVLKCFNGFRFSDILISSFFFFKFGHFGNVIEYSSAKRKKIATMLPWLLVIYCVFFAEHI